MKLAELRNVIHDILSEGTITADKISTKYPFIGQDTVELLQKFIWRYSADVAKQKGGNSQDSVREVAADAGMSLGASVDELTQHLVPQQQKQQKAPPPSATGSSKQFQKRV